MHFLEVRNKCAIVMSAYLINRWKSIPLSAHITRLTSQRVCSKNRSGPGTHYSHIKTKLQMLWHRKHRNVPYTICSLKCQQGQNTLLSKDKQTAMVLWTSTCMQKGIPALRLVAQSLDEGSLHLISSKTFHNHCSGSFCRLTLGHLQGIYKANIWNYQVSKGKSTNY